MIIALRIGLIFFWIVFILLGVKTAENPFWHYKDFCYMTVTPDGRSRTTSCWPISVFDVAGIVKFHINGAAFNDKVTFRLRTSINRN